MARPIATTRPLAAVQHPDLTPTPVKGSVDFADLAHASRIDDSHQDLASASQTISVDDARAVDTSLDVDHIQVDDHTDS